MSRLKSQSPFFCWTAARPFGRRIYWDLAPPKPAWYFEICALFAGGLVRFSARPLRVMTRHDPLPVTL
jgi:hypothetical protein